MTPSVPTFSKASARRSPTPRSLLAAIVETSVICFLPSTLARLGLDLLDDPGDGLVDAALQGHRVRAGGQGLEPLLEDRLGEHGGGGGAVARGVGGLAGGLLDELGAHVLVGVGQLDLLGDGDAVLGDRRAAPALVDHRVAAAGAERAPHGLGQLRHAARQLLAGLLVIGQQFRHGCRLPPARSPSPNHCGARQDASRDRPHPKMDADRSLQRRMRQAGYQTGKKSQFHSIVEFTTNDLRVIRLSFWQRPRASCHFDGADNRP